MNEAIQKIEEILQIKLQEDNYKTNPPNAYSISRAGGHISLLKLDQVTIDSVDALLPYLPNLGEFTLTNSTVSNISELLKLQTWKLCIENVVFKNKEYDETILDGLELRCTPNEVHIENTRINVRALRDFNEFKFLFISDSHISNIYALCNFSTLYQVNLTHVTFEETQEYKIQNGSEENSFTLTIEDCTIEKRDFFIPFAGHIFSLRIYNSHLQNIEDLSRFPHLGSFAIDASSTIKYIESQGPISGEAPAQNIICKFKGGGKPNSLAKLAPVATCFSALTIENCNTKNLEGIELFTNVAHLWFENSIFHLRTFLPIAHQIETVKFQDSTLKSPHLWSHFTAINTFKTLSFNNHKRGLKTLENIMPLRHQIKRLSILDDLKDEENIDQFSCLEVLNTQFIPFRIAKKILSMPTLKKLSFSIWTKKKRTLNFGKLTQLEHLQVTGNENVQFEGIELLSRLESLEIDECFVDVNQFPTMPNLKRLSIYMGDYHVEGLAQFPNLEELKILGVKSIKLEKLHQLKVLDLSNCVVAGPYNFFDDLPQLEKLSLSEMYNDPEEDIIQFEALRNLTNLKYLSLKETNLKTLDGIEHLQNLEYLDLNETGVTDVKILNSLKNLKEVNLAVSYWEDSLLLKHQLDRPEIAVFLFVPWRHFRVWDKMDLFEDLGWYLN